MLCVFGVFVAIRNTRNSLTTKRHAPPRLGAPLRYGPRHYIPPLRGSHLFLWPFPRVWGFESSLSTPSQAAPCGAPVFASRCARLLRRGRPPPGYYIAPLRGSNLGSRLRCCAATPWQALTLAKFPHHHPSNSDLSDTDDLSEVPLRYPGGLTLGTRIRDTL